MIIFNKIKNNLIIIIIFISFMIYLLLSLIRTYFNDNSLTYTVIRDSMSLVEKTKAFLLMDEEVYKSNSNGYLYKIYDNNTYISNDSYVACVIDNVFFDDYNKNENVNTIYNFRKLKSSFREIDDVKINIFNTQLNINNNNISNLKSTTIDYVSNKTNIREAIKSNSSGIVSYNVDGFENINMDNFDNRYVSMLYKKFNHNNFDIVNNNENLFKIIKSDFYKLLFKSSLNFENNKNDIYVSLKNLNIDTICKVNTFYNNKGEKYYYIELDNYLINIIDNRIIEIDINLNKNKGLKIPLSSIISMNCYKIPKNYVFFDDTINSYYVKKINKYGDITNTEVRVLKIDNNYYYINEKDVYNKISSGEYIKTDSDVNYLISGQVLIDGVFINDRGIKSFKNIDIIDKNQEYAIISENTYNGIKIGDKIALNSEN